MTWFLVLVGKKREKREKTRNNETKLRKIKKICILVFPSSSLIIYVYVYQFSYHILFVCRPSQSFIFVFINSFWFEIFEFSFNNE